MNCGLEEVSQRPADWKIRGIEVCANGKGGSEIDELKHDQRALSSRVTMSKRPEARYC